MRQRNSAKQSPGLIGAGRGNGSKGKDIRSLEHAVTRRQTVSWPLSVKSLCPRPPNYPPKGWSRKGKFEQIVAQG